MGACCSAGGDTPACWTSLAADTPKPPHVDDSKADEQLVVAKTKEVEEIQADANERPSETPEPQFETSVQDKQSPGGALSITSPADVASPPKELQPDVKEEQQRQPDVKEEQEQREPETEPPKPELPKPDFNGTWLLTGTDDMEQLLIENGTAWTARRFAKSMKYGVGTVRHVIKQQDNEVSIENKGGVKNFTTQFTVDGPEVASKSPDGQDVMLTASWENQNPVMLVSMKRRDGTSAGSLRRYFDGDKMIMEISSTKGTVVKRFFTREK